MKGNYCVIIWLIMALAGIMPSNSFGQCTDCSNSRTYNGTNTTVTTNRTTGSNVNWTGTGNFSQGQVARFARSNTSFLWRENDFNLSGIVLRNGADLSLDRPNQGSGPGFTVTNGCIVVGSGSILNFIYITELQNVTICVEEGGEVRFDSRSTQRNTFSLDQVIINLQGPNATLEFGDATIDIGSGGLVINGWTGNEIDLCENSNPPIPGSSGNISWTNEIQLIELCQVLNGRILPIDLAYFTAEKNIDSRISMLRWATLKEWENSHFEIERSFNSIQEWASIGSVSGQGYSDGEVEYEFADWSLPVSAGNIYYRIKQVDFDGTFSYSPVKAVQIDAIPGKNPWVLYPNPSLLQEEVKIEWREPQDWKEEQVILRISNSKGFGTSLFLKNISEVQEVVKSYFNDQPAGLYFIDLSWADRNQQFKVLRK